mmetsp:Transcript_10044/g.18234  ORF Transcript_10044/g.18234 Transcript_10044/m.18234 type:complete len:91 (+) Transcript_10044:59-331(+)
MPDTFAIGRSRSKSWQDVNNVLATYFKFDVYRIRSVSVFSTTIVLKSRRRLYFVAFEVCATQSNRLHRPTATTKIVLLNINERRKFGWKQ